MQTISHVEFCTPVLHLWYNCFTIFVRPQLDHLSYIFIKSWINSAKYVLLNILHPCSLFVISLLQHLHTSSARSSKQNLNQVLDWECKIFLMYGVHQLWYHCFTIFIRPQLDHVSYCFIKSWINSAKYFLFSILHPCSSFVISSLHHLPSLRPQLDHLSYICIKSWINSAKYFLYSILQTSSLFVISLLQYLRAS